MTLVDGSSGFSPAFMWCGVADIPGMPSSTARDEWGAVTYFLGSVDIRMSGSEAGLRPATSISGGVQGLFAGAELKSASHCTRKIGHPRAEKVLQRRPQMLFV